MNIHVGDKEFELMLEYKQIKEKTRMIGTRMNIDFEDKLPIFIGVLNGSFMFLADLMKEITIAAEISFIKLSSYEGDRSTGVIKEVIGLDKDLRGRHVVIVEDIVDTGITMHFLIRELQKSGPASVCAASLLLKPKALQKNIDELNYTAFEIGNEFVVGYGLDYNGLGRNLKDIYRAV